MSDREYVERDGPGRRKEDYTSRCIWCSSKDEAIKLRWKEHHDKDLERQAFCSNTLADIRMEINKMDNRIENISKSNLNFVPRWMFLTIFGLSVTLAGAGFKHLLDVVNHGNSETGHKIEIVQRRITETDNSREALKDKLNDLQWSVNALGNRLFNVEQRLDKK